MYKSGFYKIIQFSSNFFISLQYTIESVYMQQHRRRASSFYTAVQNINTSTSQEKWTYTILLFIFSILALIVMLFSSSISQSMTDRISDERFGSCEPYVCHSGKIATVVPFDYDNLAKVEEFTKQIISNTDHTMHAMDLIFIPYEPSRKPDYPDQLNKYIFPLEHIFEKVFVSQSFEDTRKDNDILKCLFQNDTASWMKDYCFIYFTSLDTKFVKSNWPDAIATHSIHAKDTNYWVKSPLDMSVKPFSYYENVEISLYGIYAANSECLKDLFGLADEVYPSWKVSKAFNMFMRDPGQIILSHCIVPRIRISPFGVDLRKMKISVSEIRQRFPEAFIAHGANINY